jgi:flavin-dependent dehydrogenase
MPLVLFRGGYGGMVHADGGRVSLSCCIRRDRLAACRREGQRAGDAVLSHILASCRGVREALGAATLEGSWLAAGPIRPGIRSSDARGLFLVGNAMGEAHPIVAEGINMAIQSAWLLAALLAPQAGAIRGSHAHAALRSVQQAYEARYRRSFAPRIHAAALFAALAVHEPTRSLMTAAVRHVPALLALGARWSGKATPVFA